MTTLNLVWKPLWTTPPVIERPRPLPEVHARSQQYRDERMAALLQHKETLLREVQHCVGNSLQIIASILALEACEVHSEKVGLHLENAQ